MQQDFWFLFSISGLIFATVFTLIVIMRHRDPVAAWAWILAFFLLPHLGVILYMFFGIKGFQRRHREKPSPSERLVQRLEEERRKPAAERHPWVDVAVLAQRLTEFPVTDGNQLTLYEGSSATYAALAEAITAAKEHVHLEFYIFQPDETGQYFRQLLIDKAKQGVECRLLLDSVGSHRIHKKFLRPFQEAGVKVAFFNSVHLLRRPWGFQLRNHRKLTIIDGKVGFIGSQNIGNEYLSWRVRTLAWTDEHVKVEGPAVEQLQTIFAEDWAFTTTEELHGDKYFPKLSSLGSSLVQTFPTGPQEDAIALPLIFAAAIHKAVKRITLTTPYFVPNPAMLLALQGAALKGVRVDILLPKKSDHPLVDGAGRASFRALVESGVNIYLLENAFIHAKVITVDDGFSLVGSANMDIRSFLLNFEAGLLVYDDHVNAELQETFNREMGRAKRVTPEILALNTPWGRFLDGFAQLMSPLL